MYSASIQTKVDTMFADLLQNAKSIILISLTPQEAAESVTRAVSSELASRSQSILSDMLFDLSDELMETEYFADIARQNAFTGINLRQEILDKYQFSPSGPVEFKRLPREKISLIVGGTTLAVGGAAEVGYVLASGLSMSTLVPIPICALIAVSLAAALVDYFAVEPKLSNQILIGVVEKYLNETKQQFLRWFDEIENYFNQRVEEIKQTIEE